MKQARAAQSKAGKWGSRRYLAVRQGPRGPIVSHVDPKRVHKLASINGASETPAERNRTKE